MIVSITNPAVVVKFEFSSSIFYSFKMFVRDRYPMGRNGWKDLSSFGERNSQQVQAFTTENRLIYERYLKVQLLIQHGNEFYYPVSLLRVYETTMMDEFKHRGEISVGGAEEHIIEKVAPDAVAVNIKDEVQARVTALAVEEAALIEVYTVNEAPVQKIRIQRYHHGSAISKRVSDLEVEPLFLPTCEVIRMPSETHSTPTSAMTESSTDISCGIVSSSTGMMWAIGSTSTSTFPNPTENGASKNQHRRLPPMPETKRGR